MLNPTMDAAYDYDHRMAVRKEVEMEKVRSRIKRQQMSIDAHQLGDAYPRPTGPFGITKSRGMSIIELLRSLLP